MDIQYFQQLDGEEWRKFPIHGYPHYMVSNKGRVYSGVSKKLIKHAVHHKGYFKAPVGHKGMRKAFFVHRLVALAFIPNPNNYPQVNHIDFIKTNNEVSNLEWCTNQMNMDHAYKNGRVCAPPKGEQHHSAILKGKTVLKIREQFKQGYTRKMLAKKFKIKVHHVKDIIARRSWKDI